LIAPRADDKLPVHLAAGRHDPMNSEQPPATADTLPALRFIPFRRADLRRMLRQAALLDAGELARFEDAAATVENSFAAEFHALRQQLKDIYAPLDPDADTRTVAAAQTDGDLAAVLEQLLERANYERLGDRELKRAFRQASLFQLRLKVDLDEFEEVVLYCRGASERSENLSLLFGLWKRRVSFINYDRVLLYLRFRAAAAEGESGGTAQAEPGPVMIKLFQNVPDADLEMLFPNTQVAMRWSDLLLIGVPALVSGAVVVTTKLGTPLLLLGTLFGFWLGMHSQPVELDRPGLIALGAGFAALAAYLWKQWSSYRNRKARFRQALTRNLYFKLLDNNAGVLLRVLDDAEESECKESLLALYFLLAAGGRAAAPAIDERVEQWFAEQWSARLDFEIDDALRKLARLGLAREFEGQWQLLEQPATP
jgi:hypothetical protein